MDRQKMFFVHHKRVLFYALLDDKKILDRSSVLNK